MLTIISFNIQKTSPAEHPTFIQKVKAFLRRQKIKVKWKSKGQVLIQGKPDLKIDDIITIVGTSDAVVTGVDVKMSSTLVDITLTSPMYEHEIDRMNMRSNEHAFVSSVASYL